MNMRIAALMAVFFWVAGVGSSLSAEDLPKSARVVAIVNGISIMLDEYEAFRDSLSSSEWGEFQLQKDPGAALLENIVQLEMMAQLAIERGLNSTDPVLARRLAEADALADSNVVRNTRRIILANAALRGTQGKPEMLVTPQVVWRHYILNRADYNKKGFKTLKEVRFMIKSYLMNLASTSTSKFLHAQSDVEYYREQLSKK